MKIYLDSVGCRLNQSEIENYARQFRQAGHTLVSSAGEADLVVVNTCTVTAAAASDSRQKIRQAARMGAGQIIATGCWATLQPDDALSLPGVSQVVHNEGKDRLVADVLHLPPAVFEKEPVERELLPGARARTRAFIKVQDGCDNRCTFCITTIARGAGRSRTVAEVIQDIQSALKSDPLSGAKNAAKEIVLTGVHLGSWGQDLGQDLHLKLLVQAILRETDTPRLRLSSLEPWDLNEEFFDLWQDRRVCRHLHLPLQSGCAATLKRMARKTTPESFERLVAAARRAIPEAAITTDIITGFPGESEAEHQESLEFVRSIDFAGGHVFTYSARQGTAAARMPGQAPHAVRKQRNAELRAVFSESAARYRQNFLGRVLEVLWESAAPADQGNWAITGLTGNYLRVTTAADRPVWNEISAIRLVADNGDGLLGDAFTSQED